MNLRAFMLLTLLLAGTGPLFADDAPCGFRLWSRPWLRVADCPRLCGLPDDYCRKPCPVLFVDSRCGGPDDYCRKPLPCLSDVSRCGGPDDYRRKCMPSLLCPPILSPSPCGASDACCSPARHR